MDKYLNKAFIFDMDGVIVDSENAWEEYGQTYLYDLLGRNVAERIGNTIGMSINSIYNKAVEYGFYMDKDEYTKMYDKKAAEIYAKAKISDGVNELAGNLLKMGFKLGLVSSSRQNWIDQILPRLSFKDKIEYVISLNDRQDLKPKPSPEGYLEAIEKLGATPSLTIILEDSNSGIKAAKASGAYVIGFKGNLIPGYVQTEADIYASTMPEVLKIVKQIKLD